MKLKV